MKVQIHCHCVICDLPISVEKYSDNLRRCNICKQIKELGVK